MRHKIFAIALAVTLLPATAVRAQLSVIDWTAAANMLKSIGIESEQLDQLVLTVQEIYQVYEQATAIYNSVAYLAHAETWAVELLDPALRNPLPFAAQNHPSWVGGYNDPSSLPFGTHYLNANTVGGDVNAFQDGTFVGNEIVKSIRSLATMQALASNNVLSIENRILGLSELFKTLANIGTIQKTDSLVARLNSEANYAHSQQIQSQNLKAAADMQLAVLAQNHKQWQYLDESNGIRFGCKALAAGPNPLTLSECSSGGSGAVASNQ